MKWKLTYWYKWENNPRTAEFESYKKAISYLYRIIAKEDIIPIKTEIRKL